LWLRLTDGVFDASVLSQNRRWRYNDTSVAQDIFDGIVEQAIAHGLVDGTVLYTDSTHLKANADKHRVDREVVAKLRSDYWEALGEAVGQDRAAHGKKPPKQKSRQPVEKETKVSRTDPEAGYMVRDGKPKGVFYLGHRTVDGRLGMITDTHTTPEACMTASPIWTGSNASESVLILTRAPSGWTRAMPRRASPRGWKTGRSSASPAIGVARTRVPT